MTPGDEVTFGAVVLAAGRSIRMGKPKMLLPWGKTTVINQVVQTISSSGLDEIVVVAGGLHDAIESNLASFRGRVVFNPDYANGEMMDSLKTGIEALTPKHQGLLIVLGDQPTLEKAVIERILCQARAEPHKIILPSFDHHRGHPWLLPRELTREMLEFTNGKTLRDFLKLKEPQITYVEVDTPTILVDIDTPEEYERARPKDE